MTSLVAWIGVDSRGPASIYLASDSRISWASEKTVDTWDYGRKLFASKSQPEILGYVGDVLFPSQALGQVIDLIDLGILFVDADHPTTKWSKIVSLVQSSFQAYPVRPARPFDIVYCTREGSGMASVFHMFTLSWRPNSGWAIKQDWRIPEKSDVIATFGSGHDQVKLWHDQWQRADGESVSRSVFSAFCDALRSGSDVHTGGAPQLIGLYRKGPAESFGVINDGGRHLMGVPLPDSLVGNAVEWRNELFERCDGHTMKPLEGAQRHSRPIKLR